ncbi:glycerophosphodiester phosphodiesterase family protein [Dysgonomonas sp. BGC7]|uniref:glycerophosphodiester phosphodiesterase n=1 Tax=Dysgonomonas sp. BGC7 TaxID=1658008 RepID=UPI00067FBF63|nr:glycerophosphodiester phosphodiesterase family protein [Dysgonomonas sp. BGC7]MBD8390190.1 hypothetical protein [Dysgonomonas sp. BGC7]
MSVKKTLIYITLSIFFLSCGNTTTPTRPAKQMPDIVLHKGLSMEEKIAPGNSLDAIALAGRIGADFIEMDTYVTKDGHIILMHSIAINETCRNASDYSIIEGGNVYCDEHNLQELREKYVLTAENPTMRRPIPTLEEALSICREERIYPYIEIKEAYFKKEDVKKLYNTAVRMLGHGNFSISSFDTWVLEYIRSFDKQIPLYRDLVQDSEFLLKNKFNYYPRYTEIDKENIEKMHKSGLLTSTWTVPKEEFDNIFALGFDGIISDDIAPNFKREYAIYNDNTDGNFNSYITDGNISDDIAYLKKDQTLTLKEYVPDSLYLGALYFTVEAKGKFAIDANGFHVERDNKYDDYKRYKFQYLFHNEKPFFKITALNDSVQIKSVWLAINKF